MEITILGASWKKNHPIHFPNGYQFQPPSSDLLWKSIIFYYIFFPFHFPFWINNLNWNDYFDDFLMAFSENCWINCMHKPERERERVFVSFVWISFLFISKLFPWTSNRISQWKMTLTMLSSKASKSPWCLIKY